MRVTALARSHRCGAPEQTAHLLECLPAGSFRRLHSSGRLIVFLEIGERGRELDDRDAEVVRDHVVELACDPCPLGRHRLPRALFPLGLCRREVEL